MDLNGPLEALSHRLERVQHDLGLPEIASDTQHLQQLSREHARLVPIVHVPIEPAFDELFEGAGRGLFASALVSYRKNAVIDR